MQPPAKRLIEREARALDEAIARIELEFAGAQAPGGGETPATEKAPPSAAELREKRAAAYSPAGIAGREKARASGPGAGAGPPGEFGDLTRDRGGGRSSASREKPRPAAPRPASRRGGGLRRFFILAGALATVVVMVAAAAWKLRDRPEDLAKLAPPPQAANQQSGGKSVQRVGEASPAPQPASPPAAAPPANPAPQQPAQSVPIAYRAAVLIQAPSEPGGVKTYVGTVVWRRDSVNGGPNQQLTGVVRADIDVPDAGLKTSITIEKNYDATLSASHTITIRFEPAANSVVGNVRTINVPEMRRDDAPAARRSRAWRSMSRPISSSSGFTPLRKPAMSK